MTLPGSGRRLGTAFAVAVIAVLFGAQVAAPVPPLPIALLASFDEAIAIVSDAAEQQIAALEQRSEVPRRSPCVAELLARVDREVTVACADARQALARAIETVELSPTRRAAVLASIDHQLAEAQVARARATDPVVRLEYQLTCSQLRSIRDLV